MPSVVVVGVPDIVTVFEFQVPVTPAGNPFTVAPVAPVVEYVMFDIGLPLQMLCVLVPVAEVKVIVLVGFTVIVPVALTAFAQPVKGML